GQKTRKLRLPPPCGRRSVATREQEEENTVKKTLLTAALTALLACLAPAMAQDGDPDELVLGMVPSREADAIVDSLEPLAVLLSEELGMPVDTFVSTNFVGLVEAIGTGRVDIGMFGPSAMVQAMDLYDAR